MNDTHVAEHSLRCTNEGSHGPHVWQPDDSTMVWVCLGTDPAKAVEFFDGRTIDGVTIEYGMDAVDYDLADCKVIGVQSVSHGTVWFQTTTGMFDGSRLWAVRPR